MSTAGALVPHSADVSVHPSRGSNAGAEMVSCGSPATHDSVSFSAQAGTPHDQHGRQPQTPGMQGNPSGAGAASDKCSMHAYRGNAADPHRTAWGTAPATSAWGGSWKSAEAHLKAMPVWRRAGASTLRHQSHQRRAYRRDQNHPFRTTSFQLDVEGPASAAGAAVRDLGVISSSLAWNRAW